MYRVLEKSGIKILGDTGDPRDLSDIINDMFRWWNKCHSATDSRVMADALDWLSRSGGEFSTAQKLLLDCILEEQNEMEKEQAERESVRELDEFLDGFRIIGGDAL